MLQLQLTLFASLLFLKRLLSSSESFCCNMISSKRHENAIIISFCIIRAYWFLMLIGTNWNNVSLWEFNLKSYYGFGE